ncbi:MAG TPA: heme-binding protein [Noviherbaspirillum sp.]|uniref:GlcG/HbpS family heme-binding protein n=1 Tax=Noviherbaspirillum sp. TaxID=1926288 RepID=UPI002B486895|nr:heme-binding protein [Noviherbaspirillum sp.]HJV85282.1 heme-binding protein [Noviherbaspirillum sp.]
MTTQKIMCATLAALACAGAQAAESTYAIKLMTPETALKAAQAGLKKCREGGYQVAIAVVDRAGQTQVMLRDRFAGMHTPEAAVNKAWTAVSFKSNTSQFAESTQSGKESSGIRSIPRVLAIGGGLMIEVGGTLYGGIGVSGAPNGTADDGCARAGIEAIAEELEF